MIIKNTIPKNRSALSFWRGIAGIRKRAKAQRIPRRRGGASNAKRRFFSRRYRQTKTASESTKSFACRGSYIHAGKTKEGMKKNRVNASVWIPS